jgi:hypothetical protein
VKAKKYGQKKYDHKILKFSRMSRASKESCRPVMRREIVDPAGPPGPPGECGKRGKRGYSGSKGDQGPRGERGDRGPMVPDNHLSSLIAALFTEYHLLDESGLPYAGPWAKK